MSGRVRVMVTYLLMGVDALAVVVAFIAATWLRFGNLWGMRDASAHAGACAILVMACIIYSLVADQNRDFLDRGIIFEIWHALRLDVVITITGLVLLYMLHTIETISRLVVGYFSLILPILILLSHLGLRRGLRAYWRSAENSAQVLVVGEEKTLASCIRRLRSGMDMTRRIAGAACVDRDLTGTQVEGVAVIGNLENVVEAATAMTIDEVFVYTPEIPQRRLQGVIRGFGEMGVTVHYSPEIDPQAGRVSMGSFAGYSVISYTHLTGRHRGLLIKRGMDIVGGIVGLLITGVLTVVIAPLIKLDSPGPVFFSQTRVGRNGRRFRIYKFRTMVQDAEQRKAQLQDKNEMKGLMFKMKEDPRITRVGRFLRKTSLDEFPQFFNVLKGDMSLVGTRPPTEDEFARYDLHYRRRLSMTPGLTGLWQVSGRSKVEDFDDVVRYDLDYIDHWSLGLDVWILCKTVGVVLFKRGAE